MKMRTQDKVFMIIAGIGMMLVIGNRFVHPSKNEPSPVTDGRIKIFIAGKELLVEEVSDAAAMHQGLGERDSLDKNSGMLFLHLVAGRHAYVMRGMRFPLDFIFIQGEEVVDIAENVPVSFSGTIKGATEYDKVLEVNAGFVEENNIKLGDSFERKQ